MVGGTRHEAGHDADGGQGVWGRRHRVVHGARVGHVVLVTQQVVAQVDGLVELLAADGTLVPLGRLAALVDLLVVYLHVVAVRERLVARRAGVGGPLVVLVVQGDVLTEALRALVELAADGAAVGVGRGCYDQVGRLVGGEPRAHGVRRHHVLLQSVGVREPGETGRTLVVLVVAVVVVHGVRHGRRAETRRARRPAR